jgi:hypothetical protein
MARKQIPHKIKEYLERQIVRGSSGYEHMETILRHNSEESLEWFLDFYEQNIRPGLLDLGDDSEEDVDVLEQHTSLLKKQAEKDSEQDGKLFDLVRSLTPEED